MQAARRAGLFRHRHVAGAAAGLNVNIGTVQYVGGACQVDLVARRFNELVAAAAENVFARIVGQAEVAIGGIALLLEALANDRSVTGGRDAQFLLADEDRTGFALLLGLVGQNFRRQAADHVFEFVVVGIQNAGVAVARVHAPLANDALDLIDLEFPACALAIAEDGPLGSHFDEPLGGNADHLGGFYKIDEFTGHLSPKITNSKSQAAEFKQTGMTKHQ